MTRNSALKRNERLTLVREEHNFVGLCCRHLRCKLDAIVQRGLSIHQREAGVCVDGFDDAEYLVDAFSEHVFHSTFST